MTDEAAFQAALDADPFNHDVRKVFADWLEKQGDWRAPGYRFMGMNHRAPFSRLHVRHNGEVDGAWAWYTWAIHVQRKPDFSKVSKALVSAIPEYSEACSNLGLSSPLRPSRREAEEDLCRAYLKVYGDGAEPAPNREDTNECETLASR